MNNTRRSLFFAFCLLLVACRTEASAQTSSREQLSQYVIDLQRNPNDEALRERIIRVARGLHAQPATPERARRAMIRGQAAFESAKSESDYREAAGEFQQAVNLAPWWGEAYYNLAIAQDKLGSYGTAMRNLQLYLLTEPSDADATAAKDLMYKIEYRKDKADRDARDQVRIREQQAEAARNTEENFLPRLNEATYIAKPHAHVDGLLWRITIQGNEAVWEVFNLPAGNYWRPIQASPRMTIRGRQFVIDDKDGKCRAQGAPNCGTFTINNDGESIHYRYIDTRTSEWFDGTFQRQR